MKMISKALAAIMLVTAFIFTVGCKPDEPINNGNNGGGNNGGGNNGGGNLNGHEYVDLGLPSGTLWATCNVGADTPEGFGDFFAWGEVHTKDTFSWDNYRFCHGNSNQMTKYCNNSQYGYNGFTDTLTTLQPEDDAATANWGKDWRTPTDMEWEDLFQNTTNCWASQNGVDGWSFTGSNGNSLFLPAVGLFWVYGLEGSGEYGNYWSSTLQVSYPIGAGGVDFRSEYYSLGGSRRGDGQSVRPVRSTK